MSSKVWWADLPNEKIMESAWERQMNLSGIDAYERVKYDAKDKTQAASDSRAGQKLLRRLIDRATEAIAEAQKGLLKLTKVDRSLRATAMLLPPETAALIVLKRLIDSTYSAPQTDVGYGYQVLCKEIAKSVELELNFRNWVKSSKEAAKAYAEAEGMARVPRSRAERLIEEHGLNRVALWRWKKAFEELSEYSWTNEELHFCGEALLLPVVDELYEYFEVHLFAVRGKRTKHVRLLPEKRKEFDDMEQKITQLQVVKKPMLTRPAWALCDT